MQQAKASLERAPVQGIKQTMDELKTIESMGFTLPTPAYLFGAILFGIIGYAAFRYGKKASLESTKWLGITLMFFPYVIPQAWLLYVVGAILCIALYYSQR